MVLKHPPDDAFDHLTCTFRLKTGSNMAAYLSAVRYTIYCDQILEGSNKQDGLAVLSMLEAFLK